jgi:hypothetical protein
MVGRNVATRHNVRGREIVASSSMYLAQARCDDWSCAILESVIACWLACMLDPTPAGNSIPRGQVTFAAHVSPYDCKSCHNFFGDRKWIDFCFCTILPSPVITRTHRQPFESGRISTLLEICVG